MTSSHFINTVGGTTIKKIHFITILCFTFTILFITFCSWNNPYRLDWLKPQVQPGTSFPGPIFNSVSATGFITVELVFDKSLNQTDAENSANYAIADLTVNCAELLFNGTTVKLLTSIQENRSYTVTVSNLRPETGTDTIASPYNSASFTGVGYTPSETFTPTITVPTDYGTIQLAIDNASAGDVINILPGTYDEAITVNKRVVLLGAGSESNPASNTIIKPTTGPPNVVVITAGGTSSANRLVLMNLRIEDASGDNINAGSGIRVATTAGYTKFENVTLTNNGQCGIAIDVGGGTINDFIINYCNFFNNGLHGFRIPSGLDDIIGLQITNSAFYNNTGAGIDAYNLDSSSNITISDSAFSGNASNAYQFADIYIGGYVGDAIFNNIIINSNDTESGIRLCGQSSGLPSPRPGIAAGTMTLSNITIYGTQKSLGTYPSSALNITRYSDVSNVTLSNIKLKSTAPNGLFLGTITSTPLDIGSVTFDGTLYPSN